MRLGDALVRLRVAANLPVLLVFEFGAELLEPVIVCALIANRQRLAGLRVSNPGDDSDFGRSVNEFETAGLGSFSPSDSFVQGFLVRDHSSLGDLKSIPDSRHVRFDSGLDFIYFEDGDSMEAGPDYAFGVEPDQSETLEGFEYLTRPLARWTAKASASGPIAYFEAHASTETPFEERDVSRAALWKRGAFAFFERYDRTPISEVLHRLGVAADGSDEFDAVAQLRGSL